jgi:hypothetical protein
LEKELREHKEQASSARNKYSDWNSELGKKLREFREEKKAWILEAATLRAADKQAQVGSNPGHCSQPNLLGCSQALFAAQGKLLEEATKKVFELQTTIKAVQPKIDRQKDYERQIEQHIKMQRLWCVLYSILRASRDTGSRDEDFRKFNARAEQMELMKNQYKQMELRVQCYQQTIAELEEAGR